MDASSFFSRRLPNAMTARVIVSSAVLATLITGCGERAPSDEPVAIDTGVPLMEDVSQNMDSEPFTVVNPEQSLAVSYQVSNVTGEIPQRLTDLSIDPAVLANASKVWVQADFQVADVLKSSRAIAQAAQGMNGYVASQSLNNVRVDMSSANKDSQHIALISYQRQANMTLRVPKAQTKAFIEQVQKQVLLLNDQSFGIEGNPQPKPLTVNAAAIDDSSNLNLPEDTNTNDTSAASDSEATESAAAVDNTLDVQAADSTYSAIALTFRQMTGVYRESSRNTSALVEAEIPQRKY